MKNILLIGAGDIGCPLARILAAMTSGNVYVTRNDKSKNFNGLEKDCTCGYDNIEFIDKVDTIILAVRPLQLAGVLAEIGPYLREDQVLISLAACKKIELIRSIVGSRVQIARAMPNVCLSSRMSMTFLCTDPENTNKNLDSVSIIFSNLGKIEIIPEEMMNAGTVFSGSMPAIMAKLFKIAGGGYIYHDLDKIDYLNKIKKIITELAIENGFENGEEIIGQVYAGLQEIVTEEGKTFEQVIHDVATRGGCTEAMVAMIDPDNWLGIETSPKSKSLMKEFLGSVFDAGINRLQKM